MEMNDATVKAPATANPPPATRMWVVIQKLSQARDGYSRSKTLETRAVLAEDISELVTELRTLADALLQEVREAGG